MKFFIVSIACFLSQFVFGQQSPNRAQKAFERARACISNHQYDEAIKHLDQVISYDSTQIIAYQQLGDIYRKKEMYGYAKKNYQKVLEINPDFLPLTYFGLAESEFYTGHYANALRHFNQYITYPLSEGSKKICSKYISDCQFSVEAMLHPVPFDPVNMGEAINTADGEYLPSITADAAIMIFTRRFNKTENFYTSTKKGEEWTRASYLSNTINTVFNEGAQSLSQDGIYLFFTGCNRPDGLGRCDIYLSRWAGNDWGPAYNLGKPVNTPAWESQPSLSANGRTLYFSSNRPGGFGGYDLWRSELQADSSWAVPVNLGPSINTPYHEQAPFIHPDNQTLYFSSDGWPGFGKKDLFISRVDSLGHWARPMNLGFPINSFHEENGLSVGIDGKKAYFCANRSDSFGDMDIYFFDLPEQFRPHVVNYVKGIVMDCDTQQPLDAQIQMNDLKTGQAVFDETTDSSNGTFLATMCLNASFGLMVSKKGYLPYFENFTLKDTASNKPYNLYVMLQKIEVGRNTILSNIFFDTNQYNLLEQSKIELQHLITFLNDNPNIKIEIQGHTDNSGTENSNQILSENRAKTVYNYLINKGIRADVLTYKGYGSRRPIANNDTEEGNRINRRIEFEIIKK